jgi:hypothetical protein
MEQQQKKLGQLASGPAGFHGKLKVSGMVPYTTIAVCLNKPQRTLTTRTQLRTHHPFVSPKQHLSCESAAFCTDTQKH